MRLPWFRIVGPAALCLALLPAGAAGETPKAKVPKKETPLDAQALAARIDAHIARRYDEMVRALLTADPIGNRVVSRPGRPVDQADLSVVAFYQANELKPENLAAATSRLLLGIKLECAQCHDHPFNQYSREQFWEYAAFFAGI